MTARLTLICHASTDAVRATAFPTDEPLDQHGKIGATGLVGRLSSVDCSWTGPELRARQTAEALELSANIEPMLRECNYGRWAGKNSARSSRTNRTALTRGCTIPQPRRMAASLFLSLCAALRRGSPTRRCAANNPSLSPIQRSYGRRSFT